jgi:hypothetical protein
LKINCSDSFFKSSDSLNISIQTLNKYRNKGDGVHTDIVLQDSFSLIRVMYSEDVLLNIDFVTYFHEDLKSKIRKIVEYDSYGRIRESDYYHNDFGFVYKCTEYDTLGDVTYEKYYKNTKCINE